MCVTRSLYFRYVDYQPKIIPDFCHVLCYSDHKLFAGVRTLKFAAFTLWNALTFKVHLVERTEFEWNLNIRGISLTMWPV